MTRLLLWTAVALAMLQQPATANIPITEAEARAEGGGGGVVTTGVRVGGAEDGGNPGSHAGGTVTVTHYWRGPTGRCNSLGGETPDAAYEYVRHNLLTGAVTVLQRQCIPPHLAPPTPAPPPLIPTASEASALAAEAIPIPTIPTSPTDRGVTGLDTWFWYDGPRDVSASASVRGYTVTATVAPDRWCWTPDDDDAPLCADQPGSPAAHARQHQYQTIGTYDVTLRVRWNGSWSFTGPGGAIHGGGDLATITTTGSRAYPVTQIRSVLIG